MLLLQWCLTLCNSMVCYPPGSSVHGILQAKILVWLSCPPPGHLPNPGVEPKSLTSTLTGGFFTTSQHGKPYYLLNMYRLYPFLSSHRCIQTLMLFGYSKRSSSPHSASTHRDWTRFLSPSKLSSGASKNVVILFHIFLQVITLFLNWYCKNWKTIKQKTLLEKQEFICLGFRVEWTGRRWYDQWWITHYVPWSYLCGIVQSFVMFHMVFC